MLLLLLRFKIKHHQLSLTGLLKECKITLIFELFYFGSNQCFKCIYIINYINFYTAFTE